MIKFKSIIITTILIVVICCISLINTKETSRIEKAIVASKEVINIMYNIEDYSQYKIESSEDLDNLYKTYKEELTDVVTSNMFDLIVDNREITLITSSAVKRNINITVIDVNFDQIQESDSNIYLRFCASLQLDFLDGTSEVVEKKGLLQLIEADNDMKVDHYKMINFPFEVLD